MNQKPISSQELGEWVSREFEKQLYYSTVSRSENFITLQSGYCVSF